MCCDLVGLRNRHWGVVVVIRNGNNSTQSSGNTHCTGHTQATSRSTCTSCTSTGACARTCTSAATTTTTRTTSLTTGSRMMSQDALACLAKARSDAKQQVAARTLEQQRGG